MTYYGKQRMESFKRAFFASRLNEVSTTATGQRPERAREEVHAIRIPGILTHAGMEAGELAS